jgi:hypothetical protein
MQKHHHTLMKQIVLLALLMVLFGSLTIEAQQKQKFSIVKFEFDPFDTTPQNKLYEKIDGSGFRYAIIKVNSTTPDDNLKAYNFNFGNLKSIVEQHDNELWIYVQKNAKLVTISRDGYMTINKYDLKTTIEEGKVYVMTLNSARAIAQTQMVQFKITPANAGAVITIKGTKDNAMEEMFGTTDATGSAAKALELGTYTYRVIANNYYISEGRFTLSNHTVTHEETVNLRANFSEITLQVDDDADIYVNNELKGNRSWTGTLRSGDYLVECRKANHQTSSQYITVKENDNQTFKLISPSPITGTLALTSSPLGANVTIDGKNYGTTPVNVNSLVTGSHKVTLSSDGYKEESRTFIIQENQTTALNVILNSNSKAGVTKTLPQKIQQADSPLYSGYIQASGQAGMMMGFGGNAGAYIYGFNAEAYITMAIGKQLIHLYNVETLEDLEANISGMMFGGKLGYGIKVSSKVRVTPQLGVGILNIKGGDLGSNAICATAGARVEIAFGKRFGVSLTPEGQFAVSKKEVFKRLEEISDKIKHWGTGANIRIGVFVIF